MKADIEKKGEKYNALYQARVFVWACSTVDRMGTTVILGNTKTWTKILNITVRQEREDQVIPPNPLNLKQGDIKKLLHWWFLLQD